MVLKNLVPSFNEYSIRECIRLGKYTQSAHSVRPRLLLVRLNKVSDVLEVLSKKSSLPNGIYIKPDLSPSDRQVEATLLMQRRALINASVARNRIRIHNNCIYIDTRCYGRVIDGTFSSNLTLGDVAPALDSMGSTQGADAGGDATSGSINASTHNPISDSSP